ncbi:MAG TPA: hypothetical protein VKZ79_13045 [Alphaproteobacteria bacterium]|nr:hypothetical protein [Alphaproteobacteria bacterium]
MSKDMEEAPGTLHLGPRRIPMPPTISAFAQRFMAESTLRMEAMLAAAKPEASNQRRQTGRSIRQIGSNASR